MRRQFTLAAWLVVIPPIVLALVPLAMLLSGSLRDAPPGSSGHWTLGNYAALFTDKHILNVALNTAWVAIVATTLAIFAGCAMAWLVTRTDIPGRRLLEALAIVPFLTPGIVTAIGWGILANPDNGLLNSAFRALTHSTLAPLNIYSYLGVAFVLAFPASGFAYLMMLAPMRNLSSSFDDAARLSGAGALRTFRSIHLPLLWPALAPVTVLALLRAIEAFEVPGDPRHAGRRHRDHQLRLPVTQSRYAAQVRPSAGAQHRHRRHRDHGDRVPSARRRSPQHRLRHRQRAPAGTRSISEFGRCRH